ncbi:hypothetical protein D3C83_89250 [compost metagenome]
MIEQALPAQHPIADLAPGLVAGLSAMRGERLAGGLERPHVVEERHPLGGQRGSLPGAAHEQRQAELLLERLDLIAHRSL